MITKIYKNPEAFIARADKTRNGVSPAFVLIHPDWEEMNRSNEGSWCCVDCKDCISCQNCTTCVDCECCGSCVSCNDCFGCFDYSGGQSTNFWLDPTKKPHTLTN